MENDLSQPNWQVDVSGEFRSDSDRIPIGTSESDRNLLGIGGGV
jgi:hypothetical protein